MNRVLIIGYGSIGQRHARILCAMKKIKKVYVFSSQKIKQTDKVLKVSGKSYLNLNVDYIIISNPSSLHLKTIKLIEENYKDKKILIEKPLFDKCHIITPKKNFYYIGYNLRFHPVIKKIKKLIYRKEIWNVEIKQQSYLPEWRKNIKYYNSTTAKKSTGGGVLLELSHELDLAMNLFGNLNPLFAINIKKSNLKINTDDILLVTGIIPYHKNKIIFNLSSNIFSKNLKREVIINGKNLSIIGDLVNNTIKSYINNKNSINKYSNFNIDQMYIDQHNAILNNKSNIVCSFSEAQKVMKLISKIKKINKRIY